MANATTSKPKTPKTPKTVKVQARELLRLAIRHKTHFRKYGSLGIEPYDFGNIHHDSCARRLLGACFLNDDTADCKEVGQAVGLTDQEVWELECGFEHWDTMAVKNKRYYKVGRNFVRLLQAEIAKREQKNKRE